MTRANRGVQRALTLAAEIAGEETARTIQLMLEYDPKPPFDAGSPAKAGDAIVGKAVGAMFETMQKLAAAG